MSWSDLLEQARTLPGFRDDPKTPEWIETQLALHPYPPDFVELAHAGFAGVELWLGEIVLRPLDQLHREAERFYPALADFGLLLVGLDQGGNAVVWNEAEGRIAVLDHGFGGDALTKVDGEWCDEEGEPIDLTAELSPITVFFWGKPKSPMDAAPELRPRVSPSSFGELVRAGIEKIRLRESS